MFEQYSRFLHQQYPHLSIVGDNYPPPLVNQYLAGFISVSKMALILLIILGDRVQLFESLNIQPPDIYLWAKQNKVISIMWLYAENYSIVEHKVKNCLVQYKLVE